MPEIRLHEDSREVTVDTDDLSVSVHLNRGTFDIARRGNRVALRECAVAVSTLEGGRLSSRGDGFTLEGTTEIAGSRGKSMELLLRRDRADHEPDLALTMAVYESQPYVLLRAEVTNKLTSDVHVDAFEPLALGRLELSGTAANTWRFYKHGWQSWSPTLVLSVSGEDELVAPPVHGPGTSVPPAPGRFISELVTAIVEPESQAGIVAGFITAADQFSQIWLDREERTVSAISYADGVAVRPGATLASEWIYVEPTDAPLDSLQSYGDALAARMNALPAALADEPASGWCSWYRYWHGVTEDDIVSNLEFLAEHRDTLPIEYVQIDDGYQAEIGDWLSVNEKFPSGMKAIVDRIHERGFRAGLWLAPFLVGANSHLYREHPDWVVQYRPGTPYVAMLNWGQACFALDLSRDDVIAWLHDVFETVTAGWGFDYVKIDFVYAGAVDGVRAGDGFTRAQVYRRGLEAIRDAVGDRFVLGCGNPMGPSIGLVDGSRVGPDVAPFWEPAPFEPIPQRNRLSEPSALNSIRNTIARFWMAGRLWQNDPDCVLVRQVDTSLTADEVRALATVIGLSGGMVLDSDDLTALSDERREMLSMLLPATSRAAVPVDLFESETPQRLELDCGSHRMIALFNWEDGEAGAATNLGAVHSHVFDVWERRYLGAHSGEITLDVPAHGCRLLGVRPAADRPQVIGTTFHLLQGAREIADEEWDGGTLRIALRPAGVKHGSVFVHVPNGLRPAGVKGANTGVEHVDGGVWSFSLDLRESLEIEIEISG